MSNMSLGTYAKILCLSLSREEEEKGEKRRMGGRGGEKGEIERRMGGRGK